MKKTTLTLSGLVLIVGLSGCINTGTTRGATEGGGDGATGVTSDVAGNLETISNDFTPDSLGKGAGTASSLTKRAESGDNPCAEADDLYDCQPILLRLYLDMARTFLDLTKEIVQGIGTGLGELEDGSEGTVSVDGQTVHYIKNSASNFSILVEGDSSPAAYFSVNETVYSLKMDFGQMQDADAGGASGKIEIAVTYNSEASWEITVFIAGMGCDSSDPRAPERIRIKVTRSEDLWTGKAMLYSGRWLTEEASCSLAESNERSINFYTDFVANDVAAKASVYMMPRTKSDLSDIADFGMDRFAINFSQNASTTSYKNPFCNPTSTLDALWNDNCSSRDAAIGNASYGSSSDWILPSEFYTREITLPSALE